MIERHIGSGYKPLFHSRIAQDVINWNHGDTLKFSILFQLPMMLQWTNSIIAALNVLGENK